MNAYARVRITVNGETGTFVLVNYRHLGRLSNQGNFKYGWKLEQGPEWMAEFAPDPLTSLEDIPEWAEKTELGKVAANA